MATISFFGSASTPADTGTNTSATVTITPPASMTAGMLVVVTLQPRQTSLSWDDLTNTTSGGQAWQELTDDSFGRANLSAKKFFCIFNGTWSANPVFTCAVSVNFQATMTVHQHDAGATKRWRVSTPVTVASKAAATTYTIPAITLPTQPCVVEATFGSIANNTWGTLTAGWAFGNPSAGNQVRSGTNMSLSVVYKVFTATGSTGSVALTQSASTAGLTSIVAFDLENALTVNPPTSPAVDLYLDGEQNTDGSTLTLANLTAMTRQTGAGTWATQGGTPVNTLIANAAESKLNPNSVKVSGTSFDDNAGTRGIRYDHAQGTLTPSWAYAFSASKTIVTQGFWYRTTQPFAGFNSFSSMAIFCGGTTYAVWNTVAQHAADHSSRLETNLGQVLGPRIVNSTWYWVSIQLDTVVGIAWMSIWTWSGTAWVQLGYTVGMPATSGTAIDTYQVFTTGGGYVQLAANSFSDYDNVMLDWTNHANPLLPGQVSAGGGRTTKNTRACPLGMEIGMNWQGGL